VQQLSCVNASASRFLSPDFTVSAASPALAPLAARYQALARSMYATSGGTLATARVVLAAESVGYNISIESGSSAFAIVAADQDQAVHGLETLLQLLHGGFNCSAMNVTDWPQLKHRGLMLDVASRFYPLPLLRQIVDGMAMLKMNVLNLHFADYLGVRVQSKAYGHLTDKMAGYYTMVGVRGCG
jgi:hexosaminidase